MRTTLCWAVIFLALVHGTVGSQWAKQWATPAQEALDERQDAEILKAVVSSMQEWERKHHSHRRRKRAESQVCYDGLGCFQDSGPFGYLDMLPSKPEEVATRFILYASQSQPALDVPFSNLSQIWPWAEKTFNVSKTTKVIVHGFGSDCDHVWVYEMKSALMAVENCNVICIDWGNGAAVPNYVRASANTRLVGKQLALLLAGLQNRLGLKLEKTHIIGFSLGAHVAGFAGAQLTNLSRITGLDPAGPLFESQDPRARLDSTDAMFVDVIHSNGENLILGGLGSWQPMGHVDFYPNGGRMQKGCSNLFVGAVTDILWSATEVEGRSLCNHRRAYKFFTDSLSPRCHFPAFPCESYEKFLEGGCFPCSGDKRCGNMGYYADKSNVRGTLYLITRDEEPFCAHQYHVRIESAPKVPPAVSYGKIQVTLVGSENINETFSLTQKDDAEIRVGVPLTRIAVPHPALQEPKSVELMYTAYSGWISSGLSQWSIDKLSLTDSFGKSMSVCKKGLMLETGVPVTLPLYPGECNPPRSNITAILIGPPPNKTTSNTSTSSSSSSLLDFFRFKPTPVVQMGDELVGQPPSKIPPDFDPGTTTTTTTGSPSSETTSGPRQPFLGHPPPGSVDLPDKDAILDIAGTASSSTDILDHPPWMPVSYVDSSHTNSLLDKDVHEDSRAFNTEDILVLGVRNRTLNLTDDIKPHLVHAENGTRTIITRSDAVDPVDITLRPEIKEPVLLSTSTRPLPWEADPASLTLNSTFRPRAISLTNDTTITTWRPEIKEPILNPTTPKFKAVKTRHVAAAVAAAANRDADVGDDDWVPKRDLKPPPLGSTWHHWNTKDDAHTSFDEWRRGGSPGGAIGLVSGFGYSHQQQPSGGVATSPIIREMYASPRIDLNVNSDANLVQDDEQDRSNATTLSTTTSTTPEPSTSSPPPSKRTGRQMLTVQLFPHRLATLLAQAERYARGHFLPYAKQKNKSQTLDDLTAQKTSTVSRKLHVEDATAGDNDDGDVAAENGALPPQRRPKYFPNMAESIQNLHLNNPLQLILNIFTSNNHNNNNINKSKVVQDKGRTQDAVRLVQLSKTVGISAKDKPRGELDRDVVYGSALEDASTVKPMEVSKEHVERSVRRDIARAKVLVPYTHDADKENKHKYIPLKDPTGATEAKNTRDIYA